MMRAKVFLLMIAVLGLAVIASGCISTGNNTTVTSTFTTYYTTTTTKTIYTNSNTPTVTVMIGSMSADVENGTTTFYLPKTYAYVFHQYISQYYSKDNSTIISVFEALGFTDNGWKTDPMVAISYAREMDLHFEYDVFRSQHELLTSSMNPVDLYMSKSGVCGDFAMFYVMLFSYLGDPVTIYVFDFGPDEDGHVMAAVGTYAFENNFMFENLSDALNRWFYYKGTYTLYELTLYPSSMRTSSTIISKPIRVFTPKRFTVTFNQGRYTWSYIGIYNGENARGVVLMGTSTLALETFSSGYVTYIRSGKTYSWFVSKNYDFWSMWPVIQFAPFLDPEFFPVNINGTYLYITHYTEGMGYYLYTKSGNEYVGTYAVAQNTRNMIIHS